LPDEVFGLLEHALGYPAEIEAGEPGDAEAPAVQCRPHVPHACRREEGPVGHQLHEGHGAQHGHRKPQLGVVLFDVELGLELLGVPRHRTHRPPGCEEGPGDGSALATGGSGDDDDPSAAHCSSWPADIPVDGQEPGVDVSGLSRAGEAQR
jgi:hypothetical protein